MEKWGNDSFPFTKIAVAAEYRVVDCRCKGGNRKAAGGYHSEPGKGDGGVTRVRAVVNSPPWLPCYSQFSIVIFVPQFFTYLFPIL